MNDQETFQGITDDVVNGISLFIEANIKHWNKDAVDYAEVEDDDETPSLQLTFAINTKGTKWSFQTGDNSYSGGAYLFPHWAVVYVSQDTTADELFKEVDERFGELQ